MDKFLTYSHPAVAPKDIVVGATYSMEELQALKLTMEDIKYFFKPLNFTFEEEDVVLLKKK